MNLSAALQEISKKTMGSYVKKAGQDVADMAYHSGGDNQDNAFNSSDKTPERKQLLKRRKGIKTAIGKLTKEAKEMMPGEGKASVKDGKLRMQRTMDKHGVQQQKPPIKGKLGKITKIPESNEYMDDLADRIRSHENKKERKKAEKAFTSGDYEKATGHIGGTYKEGPQ